MILREKKDEIKKRRQEEGRIREEMKEEEIEEEDGVLTKGTREVGRTSPCVGFFSNDSLYSKLVKNITAIEF